MTICLLFRGTLVLVKIKTNNRIRDHKDDPDKNYRNYYKNYDYFKDCAVQTIANIIHTYITEMKKCGKTIVLHLQECSFGAYEELKTKFVVEEFKSVFMPKEIAKIKEAGKPKLFYIEDCLKGYEASKNKLGLSSFIFPTLGSVTGIKICPTSAKLYGKEVNEIWEIILESRINLISIDIDGQKYIHYNLHLKKEKHPDSAAAKLQSTEILNFYAENKFINIKNQANGKNDPFKNSLVEAIRDNSSVHNIIEVDGENLKFKNEEKFNITGPRYMCGDFNAFLSSIVGGLDPKIKITKIPANMVDYIVKIESDTEEAARRPVEDEKTAKVLVSTPTDVSIRVPAPPSNTSRIGPIDFGAVMVGDKFKYLGRETISAPAPYGISANDTFEITDTQDIKSRNPAIKIRVNNKEIKSIRISSLSSDQFEKIVSGGSYFEKYLKYKNKYLKLKRELEL